MKAKSDRRTPSLDAVNGIGAEAVGPGASAVVGPETVSEPAVRGGWLPVHETFYSFQGEGCHSGRAAFFIRLFGCPVHCPWCDSAGTWHPLQVPKNLPRRAATDLVAEAVAARPEFVVITGGEPTIHDLTPLTTALRAAGLRIHLETSGAFQLRGVVDWVTLSPKRWKPPVPEMVRLADEFKVIVDEPEELIRWEGVIPPIPGGPPVWLHPEWSQARNPEILRLISETVRERRSPFRAGWQLHKNFGVD